MKHLLILFLAAGSLRAQCDCNNPPSADSLYTETEREYIAGNVHTSLYMKMVQDDSLRYLQGEINQSRSGGSFFNVHEGQVLEIRFRDSSIIKITVGRLVHTKAGQHPVQNTSISYFTLAAPDSILNILRIKDIKEIIIDNSKGVDRKKAEILSTYKKAKSSGVIKQWICCLAT